MLFDDVDDNSKLSSILSKALKNYSTSELLEIIMDKAPILRTSVCKRLHLIGGEEVFLKAQELSKGKRFEEREVAAYLLGQLGTPEKPFAERSVPILGRLIKDDYYEVRGMAASAIGHIWLKYSSSGDAPDNVIKLMQELILLADDPEPSVRESVGLDLAFFRTNESQKALCKLAKDISPDVRDAAEWALEIHKEAEQEKNS